MPQILDQFGQPIKQALLRETQTARLVSLSQEVAGHPARGLTPARVNEILQAAELGNLTAQHELFRDMEERDAHLYAEMAKRKRALTKLDWDIVPPRGADKAEESLAAYAKEALQDTPDFEDLLFDALDAVGHGFAALELEWQRVGSDWAVARASHRPQSWFQLDQKTRTQLRLRDHSAEGQELWSFGWLLHVHKAISGYTVRAGLARVLVWPYLFKNYAIGDLAEFLDVYGLPMRVGKYPSQATQEERSTLLNAVRGIGHHAAGIIPQSMAIEFEQAVEGTEKPFETMLRWCEASVSKAVTGNTLTSSAGATGLGSGLAEVHNEVRLDIRDSDAKQLASTLTQQLVYPLLALNKGLTDPRRCPRFVFDTGEAEDLKSFADSLPALVQMGLQVPVSWVQERLRIPTPDGAEPVLKPAAPSGSRAEPAQPPQKKAKTALAALAAQTDTAVFADQAVLDEALAGLDGDLQAQLEQWLKPALTALRQAPSAEAALELLAQQNPQANDALLTEALARALFVVELFSADAAKGDLGD